MTNNPNYKENAIRRRNFFCKDCEKKITYVSGFYGGGRCRSCSQKGRKSVAWNKGIKNSTNKYWLGKDTRGVMVKHHIDANRNNSSKDNFMTITNSDHRSLHFRGYEYLVYLGIVNLYIEWFLKKYDITIPEGVTKPLKHRLDGNKLNNDESNILSLPSRALHNKLYQEAYNYLVGLGKVKEYIEWFFNKKESTNGEFDSVVKSQEDLNNDTFQ